MTHLTKLGEVDSVTLNHLGRVFHGWLGVVMKNEMDRLIQPKETRNYPYGMIINYQSTTQGNGTHWVLLVLIDAKHSYYFDSFGLPPLTEVGRFLAKWYKGVHKADHLYFQINKDDVQPFSSEKCGFYCMYIWYQICVGRHYESIVHHDFVANLPENDRRLDTYFLRPEFEQAVNTFSGHSSLTPPAPIKAFLSPFASSHPPSQPVSQTKVQFHTTDPTLKVVPISDASVKKE